MAQYLLAVYYADRKSSAEEFQRLCVDVPALDAKMEDAGVFVFHGGVLRPESATVVRQSGGDFLITDGPYTETKEHLGGFWIIDAAEEAVQDAFTVAVARWPSEGQPPNPGAWIVTTARNRAIDRLRRESVRGERHAHPNERGISRGDEVA